MGIGNSHSRLATDNSQCMQMFFFKKAGAFITQYQQSQHLGFRQQRHYHHRPVRLGQTNIPGGADICPGVINQLCFPVFSSQSKETFPPAHGRAGDQV